MVKMAGRNNFPSVTGLTTREFHAATQTNVAAIQWAKLHGLLAANQVCATCNRPMVWSQAGPGKSDEFRWRCGRPCNKTLSIRSGSFFEGSHLNIRSVLYVIRYWAFEEFSFRKASRELAMAEHTFVDWRNFLRDICAEHFLRNPVRIGGVGVEVQIDESVFAGRKHNVGRRPVPQQWVFGGIDTTTNEGFLVAVPQRNAATLLPIIQQFIRPGTTVVSDLWAAYNTIGNIGYRHLTVNHQVNFVNPVTGAHTNTVENMWMRAKRRNKRECGTARGMVDTYLVEFMWRLKFGEDPFENIIKGIRRVYRV